MRHLHVFHGHNSLVMGLAYSPDHRYVLSGSWDGTLRLWRLPDADLDGQSNTGSPSVETTTYTFKGNDSLRDLIAPDKYHRVRPTSGGLEILPLRFDRKTGWHPKGGHGHIQTKATFVIPTVVDFEVYSLKDANFDVTLGLFHKVLLRWGIYGNTRTFVEIAGEKIEVPHMRIVPDRLYHVTIAIDVNRTLDIKIDGKTLLERKLPSNLDLRGPVVLLGGGYGHFIHQAVKVKGKRLN